MNSNQILEIQARKLEGIPLPPGDELALFGAAATDGEFATALRIDAWMHRQLQELYGLRRTESGFVRRCVQAGRSDDPSRRSAAMSPAVSPAVDQAVKAALPEHAGPAPIRIERQRPLAGSHGRSPARHRDRRVVLALLAVSGLLACLSAWGLWRIVRMRSGESRAATNDSGSPMAGDGAVHRLADDFRSRTPRPEEMATEDFRLTAVPLVRVRQSGDAHWQSDPQRVTTFPARFELESGLAELVTADGLQVALRGPACLTMDTAARMALENGQFRLAVPPGHEPLSVATRFMELHQPDRGVFYVDVQADGGALVEVESGQLRAVPWSLDGAAPMDLAAGGLQRALFGPRALPSSAEPATAVALGDEGQFSGVITVADRPLVFSQPQFMAGLLELCRQRMRQEQTVFEGDWEEFAQRMAQAAAGQFSVNNEVLSAATPEELLEQLGQLQDRMFPADAAANGRNPTAGFSGVISINGVERSFSSREEFEAVQREMMGPLFDQLRLIVEGLPPASAQGPGMAPGGTSRPSSPSRLLPPPSGGQSMGSSQSASDSQSMSVFDGMINNNGRANRFDNRADFERALREMQNRR